MIFICEIYKVGPEPNYKSSRGAWNKWVTGVISPLWVELFHLTTGFWAHLVSGDVSKTYPVELTTIYMAFFRGTFYRARRSPMSASQLQPATTVQPDPQRGAKVDSRFTGLL